MGRRRPPRLALGIGVVAAALVTGVIAAAPSASQGGSGHVVRGRIDSTGTEVDSSTWTARRTGAGEYRIDFPAGDVQLEVDRWDAVADATVVPLGDGSDIVRFTGVTGPVDTAFSFTAIVRR